MYQDSYSAMCDFSNLYDAHMRARLGKRDKGEVACFELDLSYNLFRLQCDLTDGIYRMSPYERFTIYDPKERLVFAPCYADRVVQHCLCDNILMPVLEKRLIHDNAACRTGKGTHFSLRRLSGFLSRHFQKYGQRGYFLKFDIRHYFNSISHAHLLQMLGRAIHDPQTRDLLRHIVESYTTGDGRGLPLGNQTSQWFALYYLDGLDRLIKERLNIKGYVRYMDDGVLVHTDKGYLRECLAQMKEAVAGLGLEFNNKTQISPLKNGIDYLGFHFSVTGSGRVLRRVAGSKKRRINRRLKGAFDDYSLGGLDAEGLNAKVQSYCAHLAHGHNNAMIREIRGNQDAIMARQGK
jgi:retron-type reverse transcriptase